MNPKEFRANAFAKLWKGEELRPLERAIIESHIGLMESEITYLRAALAPFAAGHACPETLERAATAYEATGNIPQMAPPLR